MIAFVVLIIKDIQLHNALTITELWPCSGWTKE